jgi:phosphomannomutase
MSLIEFDANGWHGIISREVTFENMAIIAQAVADYHKDQRLDKPVVVGYDTRFLSREYAWEIQRVLTGNGITVFMHKRAVPSPFVSLSVKLYNAHLGIIVTGEGRSACHSGLSFRDSDGYPVSGQWLSRLFNFLYRRYPRFSYENRALLHYIDITDKYQKCLEEFINFDMIKKQKPFVVCDNFYGSAGGILPKILDSHGIKCMEIRKNPNPSFGNRAPQPSEKNMRLLIRIVRENKADVGFFFNGDGSELGVVRDNGLCIDFSFFSTLLFDEWSRIHVLAGDIVTHMDTPQRALNMIEATAKQGKWIRNVKGMDKRHSTMIEWGHSSMVFSPFIPDKDAIFQALLLIQGLSRWNMKWDNWMDEINSISDERHNSHKTVCINEALWGQKKSEIFSFAGGLFHGRKIVKTEEEGDLKIWLDGGQWVVFSFDKQSETLRIVCDSPSLEDMKNLMRFIMEWINRT